MGFLVGSVCIGDDLIMDKSLFDLIYVIWFCMLLLLLFFWFFGLLGLTVL